MHILCLQYLWVHLMFHNRNRMTMKLMEPYCLNNRVVRAKPNLANLKHFLHLQYMNKSNLSLCKNWVHSRFSHGTEAGVCQRFSGLNYSTADITVHVFFIANICLACYIVTMICISSPDSKYKTNTWKVTRVVCTEGFSQCAQGWYP